LLTATTYTEENITEEGVYAYNVTAVYTGNKESFAETSNVICNFIPCEIPVNFVAALEEKTVTLTWDDSENMTDDLLGYNIYRNGVQINTTLLTTQTYLDENLTVGTYYYRAQSIYEHCESILTGEEMVVILPDFCEQPKLLAVAIKGYTITLTWSKPENIDGVLLGYNVYRDNEQINEEVVKVEEYSDGEVEEGIYLYQVSAVYEHCESDRTDISVIVGINESQAASYSIFPNPTDGNVTFEGIGLSRVEIYDIQGRKLNEYSATDKLQISVSHLNNGIYFVKMYSETDMGVTKRLVIVR